MRGSLIVVMAIAAIAQESAGPENPAQLQAKLQAANERIVQLEERIRLMTIQQQGAVQFFQAGQALCELDKRQTGSKESKDDHK